MDKGMLNLLTARDLFISVFNMYYYAHTIGLELGLLRKLYPCLMELVQKNRENKGLNISNRASVGSTQNKLKKST